MLSNTKDLKGLVVRATDGEIGTIDQFYFDDETWVIRYLTVETGGWLEDRKVLISPISVAHTDWQYKQLDVALTKKQVENSPDIDTHRPISRQAEAGYLEYYGYPYYWGFYPSAVAPTAASADSPADGIQRQSPDTHLRSTDAITGYRVEAVDGEIGHVEGFVVDDEGWAIRYIEVATHVPDKNATAADRQAFRDRLDPFIADISRFKFKSLSEGHAANEWIQKMKAAAGE